MLTILGLETSCDETAAAVLRVGAVDGLSAGSAPSTEILSNVVFDQGTLHAPYGGVVPEIAARAHAERSDAVVYQALAEAGLDVSALDAIAVTAGPGLIGGVLAGVMTATGIARGAGLPLLGVNHLEGHALTPRLSHRIAFPYLLLLASGGHCQLLAVEGIGHYRRLGGTIDDAPGEAFDKVAKMLGLGFPGGPAVERMAETGDPERFALPRPLLDRPTGEMSFSGLKTAVLRARDKLVAAQGGLWERDLADLCASFQAAASALLAGKTAWAMATFRASHAEASCEGAGSKGGAGSEGGVAARPVIAVAGGVAANKTLRAALDTVAKEAGFEAVAPPLGLCTDNGAMIAWAGAERLLAGETPAAVAPRPRWPLDETAPPLLGAGRKGAKA
ncbi:MAG: tRNA (adenosine(37)-N6)-threonylcarbamoyltransferase complex transferase subunit TsaD [Pseudomonadota bacterium]